MLLHYQRAFHGTISCISPCLVLVHLNIILDSTVNDAKACICIIDASSDPSKPLLCKNLWRLARALHYHTADNSEEIRSTLERLRDLEDESFSPKATNMLEQLTYYDKSQNNDEGGSKVNFEPMPIRASFQNPYCEYYNFGHDEAESLLRHETIESQSIHLKDLSDEELSSLSFLFGGVGDARHVMASLFDAHHQYLTLPSPKQDKFRLHMTLNDISAQLLAKDVLVLVLSHEMGRLAEDFETASNEREPFFLGTVIMYATLGHAMPPCVHEKMVECIKLWFTESTRDNFLEAFPWLYMSEQTWKGILAKMKAWVDPETSYSPSLPSVQGTLANLNPSQGIDTALEGISAMGASSEMMSDMHSMAAAAKESRRLQLIETIKTMELTPEMIDMVKSGLGEDATEEQIRESIADVMSKISDDELANPAAFTDMYVHPFDKQFMEMAHALCPPRACPVDVIGKEVALLCKKPPSNAEEADEAIERYEHVIHNTWVVNPIQTDPFYFSFLGGHAAPDEVNPVKEFPQFFLHTTAVSHMPEPPAKDDTNTFAKSVIRYYWNVGKTLNDLSEKVSLEIQLGSIIALEAVANYRESIGLPAVYQRISLSNIPDYVGMLSVFCTVAPLLASKSDSITPSFRSNCLLNTGIWKTYDDYIFSTVALSYKETEAVWGLKVTDEEPSTWGSFTTWERAQIDSDALPLTHEQLRTWLHRLFLTIVLPPDRDPSSQLREERASSIGLFFTTLSICTKELGFPAHFISSILDDLLKSKTLVTKATLSNDSPAPISSRNNSAKKKYNISAFQAELANQTAMFMQKNALGMQVLSTKVLPSASASLYELKLRGISPRYDQFSWAYHFGGTSGALALGFMLQKQRGIKYNLQTGANDGSSNPMAMMMSRMGGGGASARQFKSSKLRKALLDSGDSIGHVFSCMQWNLETQTASFWMCDDLFVKFKNYAFTLIRTDGWFQMPHSDVILGDAKLVQ